MDGSPGFKVCDAPVEPYFLCEDCGAPATYYKAMTATQGHYWCQECRHERGHCEWTIHRTFRGDVVEHVHLDLSTERRRAPSWYAECPTCGDYRYTSGVLPREIINVECLPCRDKRRHRLIERHKSIHHLSPICPYPHECIKAGRCTTNGKCND